MSEEPGIRILIAEDEEKLAEILASYLTGRGHTVRVTSDGRQALEAMRTESFDVALLDIVMPELDGLEVMRQVREDPAPPEIIIITGNGTIDNAITAMKLGAYDYMTKPYRMAEIDVLVQRAWEKRQLARENQFLHQRLSRIDGAPIVQTRYAPMQAVLDVVEKAAPSDAPILITGESGTGKDLLARAIHHLSGRGGPFVDLNCAMLSDQNLETELFGYERGAFAGATDRKIGFLEMATNGTLHMDEVSELEPRMQGRLLRALEHGSYFRTGGMQRVEIHTRLVTATNRDLDALVGEGKFRGDLLYRINTVTVALPPLRERVVDIPLLAEHFLERFRGSGAPALSADAVDMLQHYDWPGNIRELRNVIERALLLHRGPVLTAGDLPITQVKPAAGLPGSRVSLAELERRHIEAVLAHMGWHQGQAAEVLGISPKTLYRKIREYGLSRPARS
ncbi:MAG: sigma-54-dependent Fis family transcriptional regulator [Gemmatimonadota bacterium]|nr:sigma-54-dependent Fis family transcriptional regulator [Gemmatimonadota bacterium]